MGVVYYANYFVWFEVARADLLRSLGWSYREMEHAGVSLPVIEAHCEYRRPARYDDEIEVRTKGSMLSPVRMEFAYKVVRQRDDQCWPRPGAPCTPRSIAPAGRAGCPSGSARCSHEGAGHRRRGLHRVAPDRRRCSTAAPRSSGSTASPITIRAR